ncbi:MAG: type II secretion system protein N [Candidatus Omnitrophica bacterium]|nr:type II secretion system protein N [Candidatus Omnitrophota bacterium]
MIESRKKAIEIGIIIVGVLVLVFHAFKVTVARKNSESRITIEVPANFNLAEAKNTLADMGGARQKKEHLEEHLRDIFQKPLKLTELEQRNLSGAIEDQASVPEEEKLTLEGIMFGASEGNIAIISGKVVREGDMIGRAEVKKIEPDRVILLKNGSLQELKR